LIEVEGDEIPAFDGSSAFFVEAIDAVGLEQPGSGRAVTSRC
jgi:UDP-3-O-acyl-N-acetylglucosamine deacetylase